MKVKYINTSAKNTIDFGKTFPQAPLLGVINGSSGRGKSMICYNWFLNKNSPYKKRTKPEDIFVLSTTYYHNKEIWDRIGVPEENVATQMDEEFIQRILDYAAEPDPESESEDEEAENDVVRLPFYDVYQDDIDQQFGESLLEIQQEEEPKKKKKKRKKKKKQSGPRMVWLIADDIINQVSRTLRNAFNSTFYMGRHCQCQDKIFNCVVITQKYNALSPVIRFNSTFLITFKTNISKELKNIWEELGGAIEFEDFVEVAKLAWKGSPYNFLQINMKNKPSERFIKNFDAIIKVEEE